jgi:hypothetical protein
MGRNASNYQKSVIYFIYNNEILLYIGSTTDFTSRKAQHKYNIKKYKELEGNTKEKQNFYKYMYEKNLEFDNIRFECIKYPCNDKFELTREEGRLQREHLPICNFELAGRTIKERHQDHKNNNTEHYQKELKRKKEWKKNNPDKVKIMDHNKYIKFRDVKLEQAKEYYENNKERLNNIRKEIFECECGAKIQKGSKSNHLKSPIHKSFIENKTSNNINDDNSISKNQDPSYE